MRECNKHMWSGEGLCPDCSKEMGRVGLMPTPKNPGIMYPDLKQKPDDSQVGGDHYKKHKITPWMIIEEYGMNFFAGSALKYLLRYKDKNGMEDLKKLKHYVEKLIEVEENNKEVK